MAQWYDRWTVGDTGVNIHVAWVDDDQADIIYFTFNTDTETVSNNQIVRNKK